MDHVKETIAVLEQHVADLEQQIEKAHDSIKLLRQISGNQASDKETSKTRTKTILGSDKNRRTGRKKHHKMKSDRFKGVTTVVNRRDGSLKYRASYWDSRERKSVNIGTFDNQLKAAIAVAKKLNNVDEIQRLNDLLEQEENNPDRPNKKEPKSDSYWVCDNCKLKWQTKPVSCPGCRGASFTNIKK